MDICEKICSKSQFGLGLLCGRTRDSFLPLVFGRRNSLRLPLGTLFSLWGASICKHSAHVPAPNGINCSSLMAPSLFQMLKTAHGEIRISSSFCTAVPITISAYCKFSHTFRSRKLQICPLQCLVMVSVWPDLRDPTISWWLFGVPTKVARSIYLGGGRLPMR